MHGSDRKELRSYTVIPARLASTRLAEKLLLKESGKPLIQHTYEAAARATKPHGVCVATDHQSIVDAVRAFGGRAVFTSPTAASGTDRVAEVALDLADMDVIVNVQGDEPEISGEAIDLAVTLLETNVESSMSTLATPIRSQQQLNDPACVKVVFNSAGRALYFSRAPIPHPRHWQDDLLQLDPPVFYQHVGMYAYRRDFLLELAAWPRSGLEKIENLEQLRVLSAGQAIQVGVIDDLTIGIDTRADYEAFLQRVRAAESAADSR